MDRFHEFMNEVFPWVMLGLLFVWLVLMLVKAERDSE